MNFDVNQQLLIKYYESKDIKIRNKIVEKNLGLVYSVAQKVQKSCSVPLEDLVQIGCLGLIQAIERYNPEKSKKLSSFAVPFINGYMLMFLRDKDRLVKIPRNIQDIYQKIMRNAKKKGITYEQSARDLTISELTAKEAAIAHDKIHIELPEISYFDNSTIDELEIILAKIPSKHAQILRLIYIEDYKIQDIKSLLNLSVYQIKQLESEGIELLKNVVNDIVVCPSCLSKNVVKNGKRGNRQQYLCKSCQSQFVENPLQIGRPSYDDNVKITVLNALSNGRSFAWCKLYLGVCQSTAYNWLKQYKVVNGKLHKNSMMDS